jgi:hypothetical protein
MCGQRRRYRQASTVRGIGAESAHDGANLCEERRIISDLLRSDGANTERSDLVFYAVLIHSSARPIRRSEQRASRAAFAQAGQ